MTEMMDLIDGDIAKHIWGFFLEFDDDNHTIASTSCTSVERSSTSTGTERAAYPEDDDIGILDRRVDFQSIRSLRCVNKFFYNAFEEFCGWSRCALAIKQEYRTLKNDEKSFDNWSFVFLLPNAAHNNTSNYWTREQRIQVGKIVSKAMERKKISVYRCNQLIRMLDRGPFTKDEKLLTYKQLCIVR